MEFRRYSHLHHKKFHHSSKPSPHIFFFLAPPIFLVQPTDQKVAENAPAVLDCIAAGNPTPTLFWMKEGEPNIILPGTHIKQLTVTPEGSLRIGKHSMI